MQLETDRLIIRSANKSDVEFVADMQTNEGVQRYKGGVCGSYIETLSILKNNKNPLKNYFIVLLKSENNPIGLVLFIENEYIKEREVSIGFIPSYCGKGYGPESLSAVREWWLNENKVNYMFATVRPDNEHSISMLEKVNFVYVKKYKDNFKPEQLLYKYVRENI